MKFQPVVLPSLYPWKKRTLQAHVLFHINQHKTPLVYGGTDKGGQPYHWGLPRAERLREGKAREGIHAYSHGTGDLCADRAPVSWHNQPWLQLSSVDANSTWLLYNQSPPQAFQIQDTSMITLVSIKTSVNFREEQKSKNTKSWKYLGTLSSIHSFSYLTSPWRPE